MPVIYERAGADVLAMAQKIMEDHHPELRLGEREYPKLCIFMATSVSDGESEPEPAVKLHGYPCQAVVSVIPYKQRVDKRADAEIIIDEKNWLDLSETKQRALLDHEITHLEIQKDKDGFVKTDDMGRPKLKLKLHDFDFGGFREVSRRWGDDAPETILARDFEKRFGEDVLGKKELFA